ncbi:MAG: GspE/PulE family protein [Patescibacteria group bacterium]
MTDDSHKNDLTITSKKSGESFTQKMGEIALKEKERQVQMQAFALGVPYINLYGKPVPPSSMELISEEDAKKFFLVCFLESADGVKLATIDPAAEGLKEFIQTFSEVQHRKVELFLMSQASFDSVMKLYAQIPKIKPHVAGVQITQEDLSKYAGDEYSDIRKLNDLLAKASMSEIITIVVAVAFHTKSSDIHIEAEEKDVKARLRIDGILHDIALLPHGVWAKLIARVKLLSGLKINVSDRPQDGRFTIFLKDDKVDVRVSTLPTSYGESVVMRLLRSSSAGLGFEQLGLSEYAHKQLKKEIDKPNGMVITTGPTGSGKTTTLYAILNYLNSPELKIITLEDPVEYKLGGISQSQIDTEKGYTFAGGLRAILRQDPDIVMVGEIRDLETAEIAINAALTGHMVLSTIHTNSAAGAIPRFIAMGAKGFLLAPALNAMIGQRLIRKLCQACKIEQQPDTETLDRIKQLLGAISPTSGIVADLSNAKFYASKGCNDCHGIGYKGRLGIYEVLPMTKEIEEIILSGSVSEYKLQEVAVANGMITMVQDGLLRVLAGTTSIEEVFSVAD